MPDAFVITHPSPVDILFKDLSRKHKALSNRHDYLEMQNSQLRKINWEFSLENTALRAELKTLKERLNDKHT